MVNVIYPAADLALLGILFGTLLMIGRPSPQGLLLAVGLLFMLASDTLRVLGLVGGQGSASSSMMVCWSLGLLCIAAAAWARPAPGRVLPVGGWWELTSPACIATLACGILVADHFSRMATSAVLLAAATFACALARLVWTLREVRSLALHRREALTDDLTGLPNRRALFRELEVLTAAGERSSRRLALLQLDLDGFKELNDTLGHHAGDDLLIAVSRRLEAVVPGTLARLGGDEFAAIVPEGHDARKVADAIGVALHAPLDIEGVGIAVNASVGIAHFPQDAHDSRELARRADVAMYDAKRLGTVVAGYTAEHDEHSLDRLSLAADLRAAFDDDERAVAGLPAAGRHRHRPDLGRRGADPLEAPDARQRAARRAAADRRAHRADAAADAVGAGARRRPGRAVAPRRARHPRGGQRQRDRPGRRDAARPDHRDAGAPRADARQPLRRGHRGRGHARHVAGDRDPGADQGVGRRDLGRRLRDRPVVAGAAQERARPTS